jgi:hypothetical protein
MALADFLRDPGNVVRDQDIDFAGNGPESPAGKQIHGARSACKRWLVDDPC